MRARIAEDRRVGAKSLAVAAALGIFAVTGCAFAEPARDEVRDVEPFSNIVARGDYVLEVRAGGEQRVVLTAKPKDLARIETEVRGDTLFIEKKRRSDPGRVAVSVDVETLRGLSVQGSADVVVSGLVDEDFDLLLAGSVDLDAAGTCRGAVMEIAGSARLDASALACDRVELKISGAGDAAVHATEEVTMSVSGSGRVDVYGDPPRVVPGKIRGSATFNLR